MKYTLSNRQRKALLVRGEELLIALPAPPEEIDDPLAWARERLAEIDAGDVADAWEQELTVAPLDGRSASAETITQALGTIRDGASPRNDGTQLRVCIAVVVARLRHGTPRHTAGDIQWPQDLVGDDGRAILKSLQQRSYQ